MSAPKDRAVALYNYAQGKESFTLQQAELSLGIGRNSLQHLGKNPFIEHVMGSRPRYFRIKPCSEKEFLAACGIHPEIVEDADTVVLRRENLPGEMQKTTNEDLLKLLRTLHEENFIPTIYQKFNKDEGEVVAFNEEGFEAILTIMALWLKEYKANPLSKTDETRWKALQAPEFKAPKEVVSNGEGDAEGY